MIETKHITTHSTAQVDYQPRQVQQGGRNYIVVPVVMMVEGVHSGSGGPILHLQQNFSQNPQDWNGIPLTAGHPVDSEGYPISVNTADPNHWVVGYVQNARVQDGKLKADAWIDQQRAVAVNPEVVNYVLEGKRLEVSTGAITQDRGEGGEWNGETYQAITLSYQPDHLALLPGEQGACSWADGCGIRVNKQLEETNEMSNQLTPQQIKQAALQTLGVINGLQDNAAGFMEISQAISGKLDRLDSESRMYFLSEVYDNYFVYHIRDRDQGTDRYYKQSYELQENNEVQFSGDPQEVRKNVEFVEIQQNNKEDEDCGCGGGDGNMRRTKFNNNQNSNGEPMSENNKQPTGEVMDRVVALINNERTRFSKTDRQWLLQLNEEQLGKLEPTEAPAVEVSREDAVQALSADFADIDKVKELLPQSTRNQIEAGLAVYKEQRENLIKSIQANTGDIWTKEKLESMDMDTLQNLEKSSHKADYSGQGPAPTNYSQGQEVEMLLPAGVTLES